MAWKEKSFSELVMQNIHEKSVKIFSIHGYYKKIDHMSHIIHKLLHKYIYGM